MKKRIVVAAFFLTPSLVCFHTARRAFDEMDEQMHQMHQQMELVFAEMSERTASSKIEAPDYQLHMQEKDETVVLSMEVPKSLKLENVSVALEDDILEVLIEHEGKIELKITGQMVTLSASKIIKHEKRDAQGQTQQVSAGSSHMAQTLGLPARVDFQRIAPQADLTDGLLTITLAKTAGSKKIPVTTAGNVFAAAPVNEK